MENKLFEYIKVCELNNIKKHGQRYVTDSELKEFATENNINDIKQQLHNLQCKGYIVPVDTLNKTFYKTVRHHGFTAEWEKEHYKDTVYGKMEAKNNNKF